MIGRNLKNGYYANVMQDISYLAEELYHCNQTYTDKIIEGYIDTLAKELPIISFAYAGCRSLEELPTALPMDEYGSSGYRFFVCHTVGCGWYYGICAF